MTESESATVPHSVAKTIGSRKAVNVSDAAHSRFRELNDKFALPQAVVIDALLELVPVDALYATLNELALEKGPRRGPASGERARLIRVLASKYSNEELQELVGKE